jgi:tetratricopeptide (TPR) repeat protein
VVVVVLNNLIGDWIWLWRLSWPMRVFTHVSLVFLFPSALLGTISPVVAKMALDQGRAAGRTVGSIYAWGAVGSIAGTFLAGFLLIAAFGTIAIIWTIGGAMLLMAILYWARFWVLYVWAAVFIALATMGMAPVDWAKRAGASTALRGKSDPSVIYEAETQYCYVAVKRISDKPDKRMFMQDKLIHSEIMIDDVTNLQYFYTKIYAGLTRGLSKNKEDLSIMVIGGGGYAFPQYIEKFWPKSSVEVVEIDQGVTEAAMQAFGLPRNTTIKTIWMDARNYVDQLIEQKRTGGPVKHYDFIYEDAINDYSVPYQLVTKEFNDKIAQILADDGAYMVNLIDIYGSAQFLGAVVNTLKETFPCVHVITGAADLPMLRNTFVVVASKLQFDPKGIFLQYNKNMKLWYLNESEIEYLRQKSGGVVITDDYSPVENMLAPVVRQSARDILAEKYLQEAVEYQKQGKWDRSIEKYQAAVHLNPSMSIKAYNEMGMIYASRGNLEKAADAFRSAIAYHEKAGTGESAIASIYLNLGTLLRNMKKAEESKKNFAEAAKWFRVEAEENPTSVVVWDRLGDALASMGDFKNASEAFGKAVALEPTESAYYQKFMKTLEYQSLDEAIAVVREEIRLLQDRGHKETAGQLAKYLEFLEFQKSKQQK